jgi:hypothetical protein
MRDVLQTIPKAERSRDTFLVKLLKPFFRRLPRDVQTRLARDTMMDLAAAHILAKERLGPTGNARLDGNECQIGTIQECSDFDILARGSSWEAAWEMLGEEHSA